MLRDQGPTEVGCAVSRWAQKLCRMAAEQRECKKVEGSEGSSERVDRACNFSEGIKSATPFSISGPRV